MRSVLVPSFVLAAALAVTPALAADPPADASAVVAAERAFAADAAARGWVRAFKRYAAPDGIRFSPDPANAQAGLAEFPEDEPTKIAWWPVFAGIANSGDLGFTAGPFTVDGNPGGTYFTVWQKQPDGSWQWIYDGGPGAQEPSPLGPTTEPVHLPAATASAASSDAAMTEVAAAEATLATSAASDAVSAYKAVIAPETRLVSGGRLLAMDAAAVESELTLRPATFVFAPLGGRASSGGDMVWTYGSAEWTRDGNPRSGFYVRIWQKRADGWRLAFDEIVGRPPPPPPQ